MVKRTNFYNPKWEDLPECQGYLRPARDNQRKAYCTLCRKTFHVGASGKPAVLVHMSSAKHKDYLRRVPARGNSLAAFGFTSVKTETKDGITCENSSETPVGDVPVPAVPVPDVPVPLLGVPTPPAPTLLQVPPPPPPPVQQIPGPAQKPISDCMVKEDTLYAEVRWVLKLIYNHQSYKSSEGTTELFSDMFKDSLVAKDFKCGERKAAYLSVFGIAEHFREVLKQSVSGPFVLMFDESLNKKMQEKQMDIHVRFWDDQLQQVRTRYVNSEFMGHATAADMMKHFMHALKESKFDIKQLVQISMDGPAVNWKFFKDLNAKIEKDHAISLVDVGSCGLHIVHNSFKAGMKATNWDVASVLSSMYHLLKDAPARREDFAAVTGIGMMPLKFVSHRWLENVPVCERAILLWDSIKLYVDAVKMKKVASPKCNSYDVVKRATEDKTFVAKLHVYKCVSIHMRPFLKKFQTDRPMLPFLSDDLCALIRVLMKKFIDPQKLQVSNDKLVMIDVANTKLHIDSADIDIGFADQKLKECGANQSEKTAFRFDTKACLVAILEKLLEKCPAEKQLVRNLSCFNPVKMVASARSCNSKFKKVVSAFAKLHRIDENDSDILSLEFAAFLEDIPKFGRDRFLMFDSSKDRVDCLFASCMSSGYPRLFDFVKPILIILHGQAAVERGFSVNKEIEVENMKDKTLVAQRLICDHIVSVGGVMKVVIGKELLQSARHARGRYDLYLEEEREKKKTEQQRKKRKACEQEINEIEKKRARLDDDIEALKKSSDRLLLKASRTRKIRFIDDALRKKGDAESKEAQKVDVEKELAAKKQELNDMRMGQC